MQFISTKFHALLDYMIGTALICMPWIFYQWDNSFAKWALIFAGCSLILYNLLTRHELGVLKIIHMRYHLTMDMALGLFLLGSPWIFEFYREMLIPHICFGILQIGIVIFSSPKKIHHHLYTNKYHRY